MRPSWLFFGFCLDETVPAIDAESPFFAFYDCQALQLLDIGERARGGPFFATFATNDVIVLCLLQPSGSSSGISLTPDLKIFPKYSVCCL